MVRHRAVRLFAGWCAIFVLAYWISAYFGWSPFADGPQSGGGGVYAGGPRHK